MFGMRTIIAVAVACIICGGVAQAQGIAGGRSKAGPMTAAQKAGEARSLRAKSAACKRMANRQNIHFAARRVFIKDCLAR